MRRGGPASRVAVDPAALLGYVDSLAAYHVGGYPVRRRLCIHGTPIRENDARMIRRWRSGTIEGVTVKSTEGMLGRYGLGLHDFVTYCHRHRIKPTIRGGISGN